MPLGDSILFGLQSLDPFFAGQNDYGKFMNWTTGIRDILHGYASGGLTQQNTKILANVGLTIGYSEAIRAYSEKTQGEHNKVIFDEQNTATTDLKSNIALMQNQIATELKVQPLLLDANNPIPIDKRQNTQSNNQFGYTTAYTSPDADGTPIAHGVHFPKLGVDYNNHSADITNRLINLDSYEVFTGYRPKGSNPTDSLDYEFKSWVIPKGGNDKSQWVADPSATFTSERPYSDYANEVLQKTSAIHYPGSFKFFIEKLHGRYGDDTPYKINSAIKSQKEVVGDMNLSNRMVFSAYIDNYNDSYASSWSEYNFIGRAEQAPVFKSTKRSMTLEFTLLSDYSAELMGAMQIFNQQLGKNVNQRDEDMLQRLVKDLGPDFGLGEIRPPLVYTDGRVGAHVPGMYSDTPHGLWSKLTFLSQCCYPFYRKDGKMKEQPFIRLRIADFYDVVMYIENMALNMTAFDGMIDMNPSSLGNMPFGMKVTLNGAIIHNYEPSSEYFGFYNRLDFDKGKMDPVTGLNIDPHKNSIQAGGNVHSPLDFSSSFVNEKDLTANSAGMDLTKLQSSVNNFQQNFNQLDNIGIGLKESYIKNKVQKSIEAFEAVNEIVNYLRITHGMDPVSPSKGGALNIANIADDLKQGSNIATGLNTSAKQLNDLKQTASNFKKKVDEVGGFVQNVETKVKSAASDPLLSSSTLTNLNSDVQKVVADVNKVNASGVTPAEPKTFKDILDAATKF